MKFTCRFVSLLLLISLVACQSMQEPALNGIENLRVGRLGALESTLTMDLNCHNPNKAKFVLKGAKGAAWLDNSFVGHFAVDTLVRIPSNGDFRIPMKFKMDMKYLLHHPLSSLLNAEKLVRLEGKARVGKNGLFFNYPIKYEGIQDFGKLVK